MAYSPLDIPFERSTLAAAALCSMAFVVVFYLYATKKLCLVSASNLVSGLTVCCDNLKGDRAKQVIDNKEKVQRDLGEKLLSLDCVE